MSSFEKNIISVLFLFALFLSLSNYSLKAESDLQRMELELYGVDEVISYASEVSSNGEFDRALQILEKSLIEEYSLGDMENSVLLLKEIALTYELQGKYAEAMQSLFFALNIAETQGLNYYQITVHIQIGIVFFNMKEADRAISHYDLAYAMAVEAKDSVNMVKALNNLGNTYMTLKSDVFYASRYFERALMMAKQIDFDVAEWVALNNLTQIYISSNELTKAYPLIMDAFKMDSTSVFVLYNLGTYYRASGSPDKARATYEQAMTHCGNEIELMQVLLKDLSEVCAETGNYTKALEYHKQYTELKDAVHNVETQKYIMELQTMYETSHKENRILLLSQQQQKSMKMIWYLVTGTVLLSIMIIFIFIHGRNNRIIDKQRVKIALQESEQLRSQHLLLAAKASLEGEENERIRLARDLHDGLGGLLSGLKLSLIANKENAEKQGNYAFQPDHALQLLDKSVSELHRISYNLMPEVLHGFGISEALDTFCRSVGQYQEQVKFLYQFFGKMNRFKPEFELAVYRVGQELINNAIKHSNAKQITVQLIMDETRLFLSVVDDGIGFLPQQKMNSTGGNGLRNITSRVESFGGRLEIISDKGQGTEVNVEFVEIFTNIAAHG